MVPRRTVVIYGHKNYTIVREDPFLLTLQCSFRLLPHSTSSSSSSLSLHRPATSNPTSTSRCQRLQPHPTTFSPAACSLGCATSLSPSIGCTSFLTLSLLRVHSSSSLSPSLHLCLPPPSLSP